MITKEELRDYYKIIECNKVNDDVEVIDLYNTERSNNRHVRLLFAYNKLYYTGDMGTYVFGNHVFNIREFFKGKEINPSYWEEKVEASPNGLHYTDIDFDKAFNLIKDELHNDEDNFEDVEQEIYKDNINHAIYIYLDEDEWEPNPTIVYENIRDFFDSIGYTDSFEIATVIVSKCQEYTHHYLYACELIQWVENEILEEELNG